MLFDIGSQRTEDLVVCLDPFDVRFIPVSLLVVDIALLVGYTYLSLYSLRILLP